MDKQGAISNLDHLAHVIIMRGKRSKKRLLVQDSLYSSRLVTRLINKIMRGGKKTIACKHVYKALDRIEKETKKPPLEVLRQALDKIKPTLEVRPRRVGGAAYQVPMPVKGDRREALAIRWLVLAARGRSNKEYHHFYEKLTAEILAAYKGEGTAVKKKQDTQRMAEANKAFAHFRW